MTGKIKHAAQAIKHATFKVTTKAHEPVHLLYFLAVGIEAHGMYSVMALVCLFIGAVCMIEE